MKLGKINENNSYKTLIANTVTVIYRDYLLKNKFIMLMYISTNMKFVIKFKTWTYSQKNSKPMKYLLVNLRTKSK